MHFVNADLHEDFFLLDQHRETVRVDEQGVRAPRMGRRESVEETDRARGGVLRRGRPEGHAFTLEDNILTGNCFGCGEGGDVFTFLMKIDGLGFAEAVERLADKVGVQLRYEDGPAPTQQSRGPQRQRLIEANKQAQAFYADALGSADALVARQFLGQRGFDKDAAGTFGVGFAPRDGESLLRHLRTQGFSDEETIAAGLVGQSGRGPYDRFRGRLLWPIRDASGDVIGFGARRIFDDDRIEAKYLNTPETSIYKKSHVLYGIDLARREIARSSQAVVVEGYTDVMACHLAGVGTAVATCGTAFGDDHARVLRRFLHDHEEFRGEVIFTFDGDAAGQKAALRAFGGDQNFVSQTYVAIEPDGLDPCDLRIQKGDAAVRELVARRVPLYRFVLSNVLPATTSTAPTAGSTRCARRPAWSAACATSPRSTRSPARSPPASASTSTRPARRYAGRPPAARDRRRPGAVRRPRRPPRSRPAARGRRSPTCVTPASRWSARPSSWCCTRPPPSAASPATSTRTTSPTRPTAASGRSSRSPAEPRPGSAIPGWAPRLRDNAMDPAVSSALSALSVEGLLSAKEPDTAYVHAHVFRLQELTALRRITDLKSKLQRTNPVEHADRVQPHVRRAGGARAAPPQAARPGHGQRMRARRNATPDAVRRAPVAAGEKVLAGVVAEDGTVAVGTRDALYVGERRVPWETVERADWSQDTTTLTVVEVGTWGDRRPVHTLVVAQPGRFLELVRERVTASVVLQRHVPVNGRRGVFVIARRAPRGNQPLSWVYEFEEGVDPDDPAVRLAAEEALAQARDEVGLP